MRVRFILLTTVVAVLVAVPVLAGFAGTDVFLPMVGRNVGVYPSNWYTTVWIYNPGPATVTARLYFLERNKVNLAAPWVDVTVAGGATEKLENPVEALFHLQVFGAIRVTAPEKIVVTSRVYSKVAGTGEQESMGQDFAGVPASFAIGLNEKSQILGTYQTLPTTDSEYRYNFGFVETTGHQATVKVTARDEAGVEQGSTSILVREYSQKQMAFKDYFPSVSTENTRLEIEVTLGAGKVIGYGSGIANVSQDPTTFEMDYPARVLAQDAPPTELAGVTAGDGLTGGGTSGTVTLNVGAGDGISVSADAVSLADGGVTKTKLAASGGIAGQVLGTDGSTLVWQTPNNGDITAVNTAAGSGLQGGVVSGDANLGIAPSGVTTTMLAADAVTTDKILDGTVSSQDVAFNYAGSTSKGGAASDLACTGCVGLPELSTSGASMEYVIKYNGSAVVWTSDGVTLPFVGGGNVFSPLLRVSNSGSGSGVLGESANGSGVKGTSTNGDGVYGETAKVGGNGVHGRNDAGAGVHGEGVNGVTGSGSEKGVVGYGTKGVFGQAAGDGDGVFGYGFGGNGVQGVSGTSGTGVYGMHALSGNFGYLGSANEGVLGKRGDNSSAAYLAGDHGVYARCNVGGARYAGYFSGPAYFTGPITKPGGSFQIDHPLDPENKVLNHSFVESPDMKNVYDGNVVLDSLGEATVELPAWFEALNRDFRYQLTPIGAAAVLYIADRIKDGRFRIAGGRPGMEVSWQVTGIRQDAWANAHRIPVEEDKPANERGSYLHPELFGHPEEKDVEWVRNPGMMRSPEETKAIKRAWETPRPTGASRRER